MKEFGVDTSIINNAKANKCTLPHLEPVTQVIQILKESIPKSLLEEVRSAIHDIIQERIQYVLDAPIYNSFRLTLQSNVNYLKTFDG